MADIFSTTQGIIMVIFGLGIIIFIHELGHFIIAKRSGIRVDKFYLFFDAWGIKLFKFKKGDTEYGIGWLPFGGYVKLAGEYIASPDTKGLPDEFTSKPPLTRAKVFVAGALMNFILAFPFCIVSYLIGINLPFPSIGHIRLGSSEWNSSLQKGDIILSIIKTSADGKIIEYPINNYNDYIQGIIRLPKGTPLKLKVNRNGQEIMADIISGGSAGLGISPQTNVIKSIQKSSAAEKAGLEPGDEIIELNGEVTISAQDISSAISQRASLPTPIKILKPSGEIKTLTVIPSMMKLKEPIYDLGINTPAIISEVRTDGPAARANLQKNDKIVAVDGTEVKSWNKFHNIIKVSADKDLKLTVLRKVSDTIYESIPITVSVASDFSGKGFIGVVLLINNNEIGDLEKDSPLTNKGLSCGDKIIKVTSLNAKGNKLESEITDLSQLYEFINKTKDSPIEITAIQEQPNIITKTIQVSPKKISERVGLGVQLKNKTVLIKYPLIPAIIEGSKKTLDLSLLTYQIIGRLIKGEESTKGLAGPIGIITVIYGATREGLGFFLWLLSLISINLAILNLLPIPVLDGGGILFCLIEKIKGSPVSLKVQVIAQYVGLFILLLLIVYVTINDISRGFVFTIPQKYI